MSTALREGLHNLASTPVTVLKGVGPSIATKLEKLGLYTLQDVLFHLPLRYEDRTRVYRIRDLMPGLHTSVIGEVVDSQVSMGRRRMLLVKINDGSGELTLRFFHFSAAQKNNLSKGTQVRCFGEIQRGGRGFEIIHPEYKPVDSTASIVQVEETLTPVYPTTDGLRQISLRNICDQALLRLQRGNIEELLPDNFFAEPISLSQAIKLIHRPPPDVSITLIEEGRHPAQLRLIKEELLAHNLSMLKLRQSSDKHPSIPLTIDKELEQKFLQSLPFSPTNAQQRVVKPLLQAWQH